MVLPAFVKALPQIDVPFPNTQARTYALQSPQGLVVFFEAFEDLIIPPHSHKGQWGTVLAGEVILTIGGETRTYLPGDTYDIGVGVEHSGTIKAGSVAMDVFEEADRYALKR